MLLAQIAGAIFGVLVAWVINYFVERNEQKKDEKDLAEYQRVLSAELKKIL
jgi:hypothetical protein